MNKHLCVKIRKNCQKKSQKNPYLSIQLDVYIQNNEKLELIKVKYKKQLEPIQLYHQ